ncbi:MAG TPA: glycosyltransferase family 4 protein, partial [Candidatus Binatia bacterium]
LYTGRLHPSKGMLAVLQAFIRRPDIDAEFLILGDGPQRETLQRLAARDARVKLLGHVGQADLETALRRTNIFVFPSFYEGFGLALVEAMASGHACVCYDIPAVREVLGGTGVLVPPGDAAGLVEEVARLAKDAGWIETCSARAYRRAGRFSWQDAREEIDFIIRETAAGLGLPRASVSRLRAERSGRHRNG